MVTIPDDKDVAWLKKRLQGDQGQALVTGGSTAAPTWLPDDFTGTYYDPNLTRGAKHFQTNVAGNMADQINKKVTFDLNTGLDNKGTFNYNMSGKQSEFRSTFWKDGGVVTYGIDATESKFQLFVGNDDNIKITSDINKLVVVGPPTRFKTPDSWMNDEPDANVWVLQVFDPGTGNLFEVMSSDPNYYGEDEDPIDIQGLLLGRFTN
jgi:hypothetical protein